MIIYSVDVTDLPIESFLPLVSLERIGRMEKFRFEIDKRRGLGAEALLNYGLNVLCPELKTPVFIIYDDNGKPHVILTIKERDLCIKHGLISDMDGEIVFSLSHSGNYAVCAIGVSGEHAVGVDIEKNDRNQSTIAEHFFCAGEIEKIKDKEDFFAYWTLKESFIKAVGLGLKLPLDSFEVILSDDGKWAEYRQDLNEDIQYLGRVYTPFEGYTVSACAAGVINSFPEKIAEADLRRCFTGRPQKLL